MINLILNLNRKLINWTPFKFIQQLSLSTYVTFVEEACQTSHGRTRCFSLPRRRRSRLRTLVSRYVQALDSCRLWSCKHHPPPFLCQHPSCSRRGNPTFWALGVYSSALRSSSSSVARRSSLCQHLSSSASSAFWLGVLSSSCPGHRHRCPLLAFLLPMTQPLQIHLLSRYRARCLRFRWNGEPAARWTCLVWVTRYRGIRYWKT